MKASSDDFVPVTGGRELPRSKTRDLEVLHGVRVGSDLDRHIMRLLALHPQLSVRFRSQDLTLLDVKTKQALLADMNEVLGIRSSRSAGK